MAGSSALRNPGFRVFITTYLFAMMADNVEHVISYWVAFQKLHSQALGGFAVLAHWLPFLGFSVWVGSLNDRFDSRRIIQIGMALFITASLGWGYFFVTDTLSIPIACALLVLHGFAGVFWQTSSQMLLYDIVGPELLPSAVRLNATARSLGVLVGPGVGVGVMYLLGPTKGIFVNTLFYLPLMLWLVRAPYGRHYRKSTAAPPKRAVRGLGDIVQTVRDVRPVPVIGSMLVLAGAASFFIGNSYQAQMPTFATDLGHGKGDLFYSLLLGADAAGALTAGILFETNRNLMPMKPRLAMVLSLMWAASLAAFALAGNYIASIVLLFCAGFCELSFSSMAQALVQMNAPDAIRGRVLGLFNMTSLGLRAFAGITVGLVGSALTVHTSLALAAAVFAFVIVGLLVRTARPTAA
jgi:MFS family permease